MRFFWTCLESRTHSHTNIILGLLAIRYNNKPIISLYMVVFTEGPGSSKFSFDEVPMGVSMGFTSSM